MMSDRQKSMLLKKRTLTTEELAAIQQLVELCNHNQDEQLHMRIEWDLISTRSGAEVDDFLAYHDGQLIGYLMASGLGSDERELVIMVHPDWRRQGIARSLLQAARDEYTGFGVRQLLLICEHQSLSGTAFAEAMGAQHELSEHEMLLTHFQTRGQFDDRLHFRRANQSDLEALVHIRVTAFNQPVENFLARTSSQLHDPEHHEYYIATFGGDEVSCREPVGCLRVDKMADIVGIYGFAVLPAYQGRGYGRQMLE